MEGLPQANPKRCLIFPATSKQRAYQLVAPMAADSRTAHVTNAEIIASALAAEGTEYVFGLPGGEVVVLLDAIRRAGLRFLLVGHEASAAFMADVTGQITGRVGVCVATLGPGAMNLVTGVANAYLERSPVLALTAQISRELFESFTHQRLPLEAIFGGMTKRSVLLDGFNTDTVIGDVLRLARTGRPGPIHLAISGELAGRQMQTAAQATVMADPPVMGGAESEAALHVIEQARQPLALIGLGARPEDAPAVRALLEVTHWPWMTTPKGKGIASEDHPRFLGVASGMALDDEIIETLEMSDLLVGVGFDPVECSKPWFLERPIVNITRWPTEEGRYRPVELVGDIGAILADLTGRLSPRPWPKGQVRDRRRAIQRTPTGARGALSPLDVLHVLRGILPDETILSCDVGSHKLLAGQFWRTTSPHTFFMSNGLSSMGYGLPAAVAAHLQFPTRPVVALVGDGGMLMMLHNLPLIASRGFPILTVVLTDGSLSLIRLDQTRRGLPAYGTDFTPPDFVGVARACGVTAARATTLEAVKTQAARALAAGAPFLLDVPVDLREYDALM